MITEFQPREGIRLAQGQDGHGDKCLGKTLGVKPWCYTVRHAAAQCIASNNDQDQGLSRELFERVDDVSNGDSCPRCHANSNHTNTDDQKYVVNLNRCTDALQNETHSAQDA